MEVVISQESFAKNLFALHYISLESLFVWLNVAMLISKYKQRSSKNNN